MREHRIQQRIRAILNNPAAPTRVWRNNVGGYEPPSGGWVDYGLAKGSADLIGIYKRLITVDMVGTYIGQFLSAEIKTEKGVVSEEQRIWQQTIRRFGGISEIWRHEDDAKLFIVGSSNV